MRFSLLIGSVVLLTGCAQILIARNRDMDSGGGGGRSPASDAQGRWCQVGGVTQGSREANGQYGRQLDSLTTTCDGYSESGRMTDSSRVTQVAISLFPEAGSSRRPETIALKLDNLNAGVVADYINGKREELKTKIVAALAKLNPPIVDRDRFNIVSMEVDRNAVIRDHNRAAMVPNDVMGQLPAEIKKQLDIEGAPFASEIACISEMKKLPSSGIYTAARASDESTAAAVITGRVDGANNVDLVVVPDGIFLNTYKKDLEGPASEHLVEIPTGVSKKAVAYYHALSPRSSANAFFVKPPYKDFRSHLVKMDAADLASDKNGHAHQLLLSAILDYTRDYKNAYDRDPRYHSQANLTLLRNALGACMEVPGLIKANNGELEFFEEHVYRNHRDQFPKLAIVPAAGSGGKAPTSTGR